MVRRRGGSCWRCCSQAVVRAGRRRWLGNGTFGFQPSELAKLALVLFAADVLVAPREHSPDWVYRAAPVLLAMGAFVLLIMKQPDMGTAVVLCCCGAAVLFTAGMPAGPLMGLGALGRLARLPGGQFGQLPGRPADVVPCTRSHMRAPPATNQSQALIALGGGHWFGTGIGQSLASWGYLPNQYTDFIFAVIGQETGFAGSLVVICLFAAIGIVGAQVAWRAPDHLREPAGRRHYGLAPLTGDDQHRCSRGRPARHGGAVALYLLWRDVAHNRPVRDRPFGERRQALLRRRVPLQARATRPSRRRAAPARRVARARSRLPSASEADERRRRAQRQGSGERASYLGGDRGRRHRGPPLPGHRGSGGSRPTWP